LNHTWLMVDLPSEKWRSSSVRMMKFPTEWKNNIGSGKFWNSFEPYPLK
jgi:hypothetical protein